LNSRISSVDWGAIGTQAHSCNKEVPKKGDASKWRSQWLCRYWMPAEKEEGKLQKAE
jgi:hypothetical protein